MNSLNVSNPKSSEVGVAHAERCNPATMYRKIDDFFDRHETTRKIVAKLPLCVLGGAILIEKVTSHNLLPEMSISWAIAMMTIGFTSALAERSSCSLKQKRVERLN